MSKMRRKQLIIKLMRREIKRLRKENKQLHDKHWNECRQISAYDEENRKLRSALLAISGNASEQPTKPKKTYKEDFLEKFPNAELDVNGNPRVCRISCYGYCNCSAIGSCAACWNEVMPDD